MVFPARKPSLPQYNKPSFSVISSYTCPLYTRHTLYIYKVSLPQNAICANNPTNRSDKISRTSRSHNPMMHITINEQLRMQTRISQTNNQKGKVKPYHSMFLNTKNKRTTIPAKIELPTTAQTTDSTISASKKFIFKGEYVNTMIHL